ncbi:multifunctional CCA addition/repair protein [Alloalcanivorax gelatiniphagus]|uniref:Multifunctional CCA protein n=1 Tax=Alloalcanivorax gelatiniphagus TaxID=1194167 RepID=A0ABY2XSV4_9GAMM|nr:multifunctional CCA addition/repair protein [Alloalcanivorax gelatiniphagus]TMW15234.1 multifunctional CCA addition/repair protein [Alloalcanivorax gelatiniphagus]|tara:strand:- start:4966 stop:6198 length:1233 start_codon:yes stop_codon:yes gene_type:complete
MDIYLVGGAVRDELLGLPVKERDWVVVGATPQQLIDQGFKPVGKDFPVFLHPETREEYALARTERKSGHGYTGFLFHAEPDVTLEQDLIRRDLTVNAMARTADGKIIDPFGGKRDLKARLLRHVSPAFTEDPLRVLRVARLAARYRWMGFRVAEETLELMTRITISGELAHLPAERVWKETNRALMEKSPQAFFQTLHDCGALAELFPELAHLDGVPQCPDHHPTVDVLTHQYRCLAQAARQKLPLTSRYALLCHDLGKAETPPDGWPEHKGHERRGEQLAREMSERLRVSRELADAAVTMVRWQRRAQRALKLRPADVWEMLHNLDVLRRPRRLKFFLSACEADARTCAADPRAPFPQGEYLAGVAEAVRKVDVTGLREAGLAGQALGHALDEKRLKTIKEYKKEFLQR